MSDQSISSRSSRRIDGITKRKWKIRYYEVGALSFPSFHQVNAEDDLGVLLHPFLIRLL